MKITRLILGFWIFIFMTMHFHFFELSQKGAIIETVISVLSISAIAIFISTLFRIDRDVNGELCYNRENFYWKHMSKFWRLSGNVKLCTMYWLTVFIVLLSYLILLILSCACYGAIEIIKKLLVEYRDDKLIIFKVLITILCIVGVAAGLAYFSKWISKKINKKVSKILDIIAEGLIILLILFISTPLIFIPTWQTLIEIATSNNIIVIVGFILFLSMISVYLIMKLAFKYIPSLKSTLLGRLYSSSEEKLCPIVYACDYNIEK